MQLLSTLALVLSVASLSLANPQPQVTDPLPPPPSCRPKTVIKTITMISTHSCFSFTTTVSPKTCPPNNKMCVRPSCTTVAQITVPCKDVCCPGTPTVTETATTCLPYCTAGCTTIATQTKSLC